MYAGGPELARREQVGQNAAKLMQDPNFKNKSASERFLAMYNAGLDQVPEWASQGPRRVMSIPWGASGPTELQEGDIPMEMNPPPSAWYTGGLRRGNFEVRDPKNPGDTSRSGFMSEDQAVALQQQGFQVRETGNVSLSQSQLPQGILLRAQDSLMALEKAAQANRSWWTRDANALALAQKDAQAALIPILSKAPPDIAEAARYATQDTDAATKTDSQLINDNIEVTDPSTGREKYSPEEMQMLYMLVRYLKLMPTTPAQ